MTFTNGKHPYNGKYNSSGQRKRSKLYKGMHVSFKELGQAFDEIDRERNLTSKNSVMSGRRDKEIRKKVQAANRERQRLFKEEAEKIARREMNMFRPKPWWVPMRVWVWALGFFIRIKR